jgi:hypothetical protein
MFSIEFVCVFQSDVQLRVDVWEAQQRHLMRVKVNG